MQGWVLSLKVPNQSSALMWTCHDSEKEIACLHLSELYEALCCFSVHRRAAHLHPLEDLWIIWSEEST